MWFIKVGIESISRKSLVHSAESTNAVECKRGDKLAKYENVQARNSFLRARKAFIQLEVDTYLELEIGLPRSKSGKRLIILINLVILWDRI